MWLFTETGFISAVRHRDQPGHMMVRARDKESLETLAAISTSDITKTPTADYPYRTVVTDNDLTTFMNIAVDTLDYDNFKSRVAVSRGYDYAHALTAVWSAMHDVEDVTARQRSA